MTSRLSFSNIAELRNEKVIPSTVPSSRYVGLEHIEQNSLLLSGWGNAGDVDSQKQKFLKGDILFGKLRPYFRKVVVAPFDGICSTDIWVVKPIISTDRDFVFYWMASDEFINRATNASEGTKMPRAKWDWVSGFELPYMSVKNRQRVGLVLRALDEKIIQNQNLSQTLEEIAQTIFKSWFIDFDPVKAKMVGEKPVGMDDATAILFPKSMKDSELGPIPDNWTASQIGEEVECVGGSTPSTSNSEFWDGDIYWTTPKDLSKQVGLVTTSSERKITMKGLQKISSGVLPVNSVLMSSRAPIGYLSINAVPTAINQGFIALRHSSKFSPLFLLYWLQRNMPEIKNRAGGGTFAEISRTAFKSIPFVVPTTDVLNKFEEISTPILLQLTALTMQNQELVELRDSLLPRLISGELQIPEDMLVS